MNNKKKCINIIAYIIVVILAVFYLATLVLGSKLDVSDEYKLYYVDGELSKWPGENGLDYYFGNTIAGMDTPGAIFASLFGSVTARTAGFNTVDTAALTQESKLLTIVLMFIGGSPGSTAGGIKTTTMAVMIIYIVSYMRGSNGCNVFGRKISSEVIKKAGMVLIINLVLGLTAVIAILATSNMKMDDVLFEVYSAISTVGMTTGITRDLNTVGRIIIIIMMYCGRIGSMTFVLSFVHRQDKANIEHPEEKVIIG